MSLAGTLPDGLLGTHTTSVDLAGNKLTVSTALESWALGPDGHSRLPAGVEHLLLSLVKQAALPSQRELLQSIGYFAPGRARLDSRLADDEPCVWQGTFPQSWGLPGHGEHLDTLDLSANQLTGTLQLGA